MNDIYKILRSTIQTKKCKILIAFDDMTDDMLIDKILLNQE